MSAEPPFVFVSYSRADREYANEFVARLRERDVTTWYDQDIRPGQPWQPTLEARIRTCRAVVVLMSETAINGVGVPQEITLGKRAGKRFFPVRLGPARFDSLADFQEEACLDGTFPRAQWYREVRALLAPQRWWRRTDSLVAAGVTAAVLVAALLTGAALLDRPAAPAKGCGRLAAHIDAVTEESPGHTGRTPVITVTVCTPAPDGHEYWIMDWTEDGDTKRFYPKHRISGSAGTAPYPISHSGMTEVGSMRSYVVVDVPQPMAGKVRDWASADDNVPQVGPAAAAPGGVTLISEAVRRAL
ncbi:toll/interleukin-1 receptor domain-containing protein [Dactylosporangium vinaceum]|uniref:Toll/interleukin-1 receptor domain-containing protein n=1 Tax=Dactylosporangium vinaceum TaxID=53362 RepID=A0ABV5MD08_9ACTN|nr:toll/interleukin-1 receptor domain-containing protein [Dactylosporangium vinaceum]UAC00793.1 toll/interleukin-1 receptor domain-containing protein [Dactylosporangium vinaceum]